jgi:DNA-binding transcriptional regulator YdaS (Cro superfamily)
MLGIEKVINEAGGQVALANQLGVSQQSISLWKRQGWVPYCRLVEIESQYGVHRMELVKPAIKELLLTPDI